MKRKIATLGETDITVHPAAGILLLLGLLTRWRALLICTYASIILHETAHAAVSALWHHPPQEVEITPLGAMMRLEDEERLPLTARISVILAGPLMTLILCARHRIARAMKSSREPSAATADIESAPQRKCAEFRN